VLLAKQQKQGSDRKAIVCSCKCWDMDSRRDGYKTISNFCDISPSTPLKDRRRFGGKHHLPFFRAEKQAVHPCLLPASRSSISWLTLFP
jgi:hypothetical protein